jgi:hypothetical protein
VLYYNVRADRRSEYRSARVYESYVYVSYVYVSYVYVSYV